MGSPGISHMRTGIAPSTFASDHPAKHIYSSKAFRKQADNIHWEKIIPLLALVLIWTQGLLISFYIEKVPVCFCALLVLPASSTDFSLLSPFMKMHFLKKNYT